MFSRRNACLWNRSATRGFAIAAAASLAVAVPAFGAAAPAAKDNTFADLTRPGPVIRITGNQGYKIYTLISWFKVLSGAEGQAYWDRQKPVGLPVTRRSPA